MRHLRGTGTGQIGNGARHFKHAVVGARGEAEAGHGLAQQRLAFYRSLGYQVADIGFVQPPLRPDLQPVPYLIVSYPCALTPDDAESIREILTTVIYRGR